MDSAIVYFLNDIIDEEASNERRSRQNLRNSQLDIFEIDETSFIRNFRLNKAAFEYVLKEVEDFIPQNTRSTALSAKLKLAACLRFFAQGSYQQSIGNDNHVNIAQSTFSEILTEMLNLLEEKLCPKWIKIKLSQAEKTEAKQNFYQKCGIPGVTMCVDGTHIKIVQPKINKHLYYNRKGYYSMNTLIICDHLQYIRYVDARFQGANHDAHIWSLSGARQFLKNEYDNGDKHTRILGDSGYPLEPWLITPFRNPGAGTSESIFNTKHSKGRIIIERTIGLLKNRFRCLHQMRALHYEPSKVIQIINVCCALHNICLHHAVESENFEDDILENSTQRNSTDESQYQNIDSDRYHDEAIQIRRRIADIFSSL